MKKLQSLLMTLSVLCMAVPAFAQSGTGVVNLAPIGIGIGLALAAGLCGLGQGKATASITLATAIVQRISSTCSTCYSSDLAYTMAAHAQCTGSQASTGRQETGDVSSV